MMRTFSAGAFCANLAFLLLVACVIIASVMGVFSATIERSFVESAALTGVVLNLLCLVLVAAIIAFACYIARRQSRLRQ